MANETVRADSVLKVGQRLVFFSDTSDEQYSSRIEDIVDNKLIVAMPMDGKRRPIIPAKGAHLFGAAFADECQYKFFSTFYDKGLNSNIPCWWIAMPDKLERHQNRKYVRVRVDLPIQVRIMDDDGGFQAAQTTHLLNISGDGLGFVLNKRARIGSQVMIEIYNLPDIGTLSVMGRIMRCSEVKLDGETRLYRIGVQMLNLTRPVRNRLVRYIFDIQRKEIAKGLNVTGGPK